MTDFKPSDLSQLDRDRFSGYKSNLDFYNGSQWAVKSKNRQLVFNYSKTSIDKITSYLMTGLNFAFESLSRRQSRNRQEGRRPYLSGPRPE